LRVSVDLSEAPREVFVRPQKSVIQKAVSSIRPIRLASLVGASLLLATAGASAVESYGRKVQRVYGWSPSAKPVEALMQGVRYHVPQNYLDMLEIELDGSSSGFLAIAALPDLQPRDAAGYEQWRRIGGHSHWARVLVDVAPPHELQRWFSTRYQIHGGAREPSEFVGLRVGLREYRPIGESPLRSVPYYRLEPDDPLGQRLFITCKLKWPNAPESFSAGCSQYFTVDNLIVKVSYAARYAEDWAAIRENTTQLLRSFRNESNGGKDHGNH
jgi:hypothetical protein